jgi:hypothetical protein
MQEEKMKRKQLVGGERFFMGVVRGKESRALHTVSARQVFYH